MIKASDLVEYMQYKGASLGISFKVRQSLNTLLSHSYVTSELVKLARLTIPIWYSVYCSKLLQVQLAHVAPILNIFIYIKTKS